MSHFWASEPIAKPFGKVSSPLKLVHFDICGSLSVKASHGAFYFLLFIDVYTRYGYVCLLSCSYKTLGVFKCFVAEVETQLDRRVTTLRTCCGHEYLSI